MTAQNGSTERSPLLGRTTSTVTNGEHEGASISTLRGTIIVALVGFLVFMQGITRLFFGMNSCIAEKVGSERGTIA